MSPRTTKISLKLLQSMSHRRFIRISIKMTPPQEPKDRNKFLSTTIAHSLKAAIFRGFQITARDQY